VPQLGVAGIARRSTASLDIKMSLLSRRGQKNLLAGVFAGLCPTLYLSFRAWSLSIFLGGLLLLIPIGIVCELVVSRICFENNAQESSRFGWIGVGATCGAVFLSLLHASIHILRPDLLPAGIDWATVGLGILVGIGAGWFTRVSSSNV
jgi:hypothetical protein